MKLRSHASASSFLKDKGKLKYTETSDEDDNEMVLDSDYDALSDAGEDILNVLQENGEAEPMDLNLALGIEHSVIHDDLPYNVPKRRKISSLENRGKQSTETLEDPEEEGEEEIDVDIEPEIYNDRAAISEVLEERIGRKTKNKKRKGNKPVLMWEVVEEETERWIEANSSGNMDSVNQNEMTADVAEAPDELIIPLLRYQKEWLAWALKQEDSDVKGGILADEMGMGKTLQAIALVLVKRKIQRGIFGHDLPSSLTNFPEELPVMKGTIVICPLVAVMQWVSEIDRFTLKGSTKVLVYHGANRAKHHYQFSEYDFVITTYSIVEAEYRKYVMPPKEKCQYCGKLFYDKKLKLHLKYFCGPTAIKTSQQSKQQKKEVKSKKKWDSNVYKAHASLNGRKQRVTDKEQHSGSTSENPEGNGHSSYAGKSILHSVVWDRVILDEAHYIKERRSNTTRAVLALQSSYKWALSGTPLQNRVGELYSLVRFLQMVPYSYYFCKDCDCRMLDYSTSECPGCDHKSVRHFCWWNRNIASPIQDSGNTGPGKGAVLLLKHKILKSIVLRRTKKGRAADLALPPRIVTLRRDSLDVVEEDYYTALYNESQAQFNTYIEAGTVLNNYAHIFDLLTRLRQAVDHPYLVEYSLSAMERKGKALDTRNGDICSLCRDPEEDIVVTSCGHVYCKGCLMDSGSTTCPSCSKPLTVDFSAPKDDKKKSSRVTVQGFRSSSILNRIQLGDFQTSTKIDALREEIRFMLERDGSAKGIIFSQFSSFLDLIHYSLQKSGVTCVQLDGSMTMGARETAIKRFSEDPKCTIFLMSLKAGGVALNLTVASHVFLMDPWWNPAVERQAQDRIHRIGQYKPIRVVRFVIENTIEERILKLQEKKELVFEGTVGGSSEALAKLTEADLRFLFVT